MKTLRKDHPNVSKLIVSLRGFAIILPQIADSPNEAQCASAEHKTERLVLKVSATKGLPSMASKHLRLRKPEKSVIPESAKMK